MATLRGLLDTSVLIAEDATDLPDEAANLQDFAPFGALIEIRSA
jgi:hypothetical protein